ncbi:MAG: hypothetical protein IKB16_15820 [Lentisphaeria bacterium]|nr:hypothetical protein [Lentisphaeria bacterium]
MMTVLSAITAVLTMAHSVVDDVDFNKITDEVMHSRQYSQKQIAYINQTIKREFDKGINLSKKSTRKKIFDTLGHQLVMTPANSLQEVNCKKIRNAAIVMMNEEFHGYDAEKLKRELYEEAKRKYKFLREGDIVTVYYRFNGKQTSVTGELHHVELYKKVSVDNTVVSFLDMDDIQQQLFADKSVESLRTRYVKEHFKALEEQHYNKKRKYLSRQYQKLLELACSNNEKCGYIYNDNENQWWSVRFTINRILDDYAGKQQKIMKQRIENALTDLGIDK